MSDVDRDAGASDDGRDAGRDDAAHEGAGQREGAAGGGTPLTQQLGRVAMVVIAVLFLVFAFANAQHVDFSWLVGETQVTEQGGERVGGGVPLIVLMLGSFVAGAALAGLVAWQRGRHKR